MKFDIKEFQDQDKVLAEIENDLMIKLDEINDELSITQRKRLALHKMIEAEKEVLIHERRYMVKDKENNVDEKKGTIGTTEFNQERDK